MRAGLRHSDDFLRRLSGEDWLAAHGADVALSSPGPGLVVRQHEQSPVRESLAHGLTEIGKVATSVRSIGPVRTIGQFVGL